MSNASSDKPKIESAKSGRSKCRGCQEKIEKGVLRVGIPYPFTTPKGEVITSYRWYHPTCTPPYNIPDVISELEKEPLEDEDQKKKILEHLKQIFEKSPSRDSRREPRRTNPFIEHSKSSRGKCKTCDAKIEKDELRVAEPTLVELDNGRKFSSNRYFHVNCYLQTIDNPETVVDDLITNSSSTISDDDILYIKDLFSDLFSNGSSLEEVLALIKEDPIQLSKLKKLAKEKGIDFSTVEKAIERGLAQGIYFKPTPKSIQKLA
jgi:hypothetical protein